MDNKLQYWQGKYSQCEAAYSSERRRMDWRQALYDGTNIIKDNNGNDSQEKSSNTYNFTLEMIESQIDSSIPMPKVTARYPNSEQSGFRDNSKAIEGFIASEFDRLPMEQINDEDERTTPIQGGDFFLPEWDNSKRTHTTVGELSIRLIHPKQLIPQRGILNFRDSDYFFIVLDQTREYIKRRYNVDVSEGQQDGTSTKAGENPEEMVIQIICYYLNGEGKWGLFSWSNDTVLEDVDDYRARRVKRCKKCDRQMAAVLDECPDCGSKKLEIVSEEYEEITEDIVLEYDDGTRKTIPAMTQKVDEFGVPVVDIMTTPEGLPMLDANGMPIAQPVMEQTRIPRYYPDVFPLVMRKNVSTYGRFLGSSDVDAIAGQQNAAKKYMTKIEKKLLTAGAIVELPEGVNFEATNEDMTIVRRPQNMPTGAVAHVSNLQADISKDMALFRESYENARSTLGVTDSFQGKRDPTAQSGRAKEFSAAQAAGRFESKRTMKHSAYADIAEVMFKLFLAYSDEPRPYFAVDDDGRQIMKTISRFDFLERDAAGEWFWNDNYLFSTDVSGTLAQNRQAMWEETRNNFTMGAFGSQQDMNTLIRYWGKLELLHYPGAGETKRQLENEKKRQEEMQNALPEMQTGMRDSLIPNGGGGGQIPDGADPNLYGAGDGLP